MKSEPKETTTKLNISLPASMRDFINQEVAEGGYSTPSEYMRELVLEAKRRKADERLEQLLLESLDSGPATPMTKKDWEAIKRRGLQRIHQKGQKKVGKKR